MSKIKQKAFLIAVGDLGGRGLAFITSIYLARQLGAEFYGLITVAISILGYATFASDLGLMNIGVREVAKEPLKRNFRAKEIFNLKVALAAVVLIISTIIIGTIPMGEIQKQVILGYLYSLIPYALLLEWYYNGNQSFGKVALSKLVNGAIYLTLIYLLVKGADDVTMVPILYTIGITSAVAVLATFSVFDKPFSLPPRGLNYYSKLFKNASILGMGSIFAQVVHLLPPIIIGAMLTLKDAGIYGAAFKVIMIAMMLDRIFVNLLLPNLSSIWNANKELAARRVQMVLNLIMVGGVILVLLISVNAELIVGLLFGAEYSESAPVLKILSLFILLTFLNSLFSFGLIATGNDKSYFLATSIGGTIAIILIAVFSNFGNAEYVAISVVLAELALTLFSYIWFRKSIRLNFKRSLITMSFSAIVLFSLFYYYQIHPLIASVVIIFIIPVISWNAKVVQIGEISWAKEKLLR